MKRYASVAFALGFDEIDHCANPAFAAPKILVSVFSIAPFDSLPHFNNPCITHCLSPLPFLLLREQSAGNPLLSTLASGSPCDPWLSKARALPQLLQQALVHLIFLRSFQFLSIEKHHIFPRCLAPFSQSPIACCVHWLCVSKHQDEPPQNKKV